MALDLKVDEHYIVEENTSVFKLPRRELWIAPIKKISGFCSIGSKYQSTK